jgi:hypothetical protein
VPKKLPIIQRIEVGVGIARIQARHGGRGVTSLNALVDDLPRRAGGYVALNVAERQKSLGFTTRRDSLGFVRHNPHLLLPRRP